jgi:hypothetical protein
VPGHFLWHRETTPAYTGDLVSTSVDTLADTVRALYNNAVWNANKLQGQSVSSTTPSTNQMLQYDGTKWALISPGGDATISSGTIIFATQITAGNYAYVTVSAKGIATSGIAVTETTLTDGSTVTLNGASSLSNHVTIAGNRTLALSNITTNVVYRLTVTQGGSGNFSLTPNFTYHYPGSAGGVTTALPMSTAPGAVDIYTFYYDGTTYWFTYGLNN